MTIQSNFPAIKPSLLLDFANTKQLDSRITYTRASTASFYNGVTTAKAEENLLIRSAEFDNATWGKTRSTVTANAVAAPDGTTTAESLDQATGQTSSGLASQYLTLPANTHVFSVFAKANTKSKIFLRDDFNSARSTWFDLSAGTVGTTNAGHTASISSVGSSWYRCVIVFTSTAQNNQVIVGLADTDNSTTVTDSGGVYVWGAQLEQRSAVSAYTATTTQAITNYIPALQSAASGVARFDNNPTTGESLGLLIEESRTNLVTYSSQFDNAAWTKYLVTTSSNTLIGPDGTLAADTLTATAGAGYHYLRSSSDITTSGSNTFSFYVKKGTATWIMFGVTDSSLNYFNLDTGAFGTTPDTCSVQSVGNSWYRISVTRTLTAASCAIGIAGSNGGATYTATGYETIYIWGAQLEAGAFATSYIPTVASQVTRAADAASMTGTNFSTWYNQGEGTVYFETLTTTAGTDKYNFEIGDGTANNRISAVSQASNQDAYVIVNGSILANANLAISRASSIKGAIGLKVNDIRSAFNGSLGAADTSATIPSVNALYLGSARSALVPLNGTISKFSYYPLRVTNAQLQALTS